MNKRTSLIYEDCPNPQRIAKARELLKAWKNASWDEERKVLNEVIKHFAYPQHSLYQGHLTIMVETGMDLRGNKETARKLLDIIR